MNNKVLAHIENCASSEAQMAGSPLCHMVRIWLRSITNKNCQQNVTHATTGNLYTRTLKNTHNYAHEVGENIMDYTYLYITSTAGPMSQYQVPCPTATCKVGVSIPTYYILSQ